MARESRTLGPVERALHLSALPGLEEVEGTDLAVLAENATERSFRRGEVVLRGGEPVRAVHVVVEGSLRATGEGAVDARVGPRETLAMLSLLARSARGIDAVAEADTLCLAIDADALLDVFEDNFGVVQRLFRRLAVRTLEVRRTIPDGTLLAPRAEPVRIPDRGLDLVERLVLLRSGGAFARASLDALSDLAAQMDELRLPAGERLWSAGDPSGQVVLVLDGVVRCGLEDGRGFRGGPGYPLGNLESLAGLPRWFDATVEEPLVALSGDSDGFLDVLEDHVEMAMDMLQQMAANLLAMLGDGTEEPVRRERGAPAAAPLA